MEKSIDKRIEQENSSFGVKNRYSQIMMEEDAMDETDVVSSIAKAVFPPDPPEWVQIRTITCVGIMESGKSTVAGVFCDKMVKEVLPNSKYHTGDFNENVKVFWGRSFKTILEQASKEVTGDTHYVIIIVDDPIRAQSSKKVFDPDSVEVVADLAEIRHLFEDYLMSWGMIVLWWLPQRYRELLRMARNSLYLIFKTLLTEEDENRAIAQEIGEESYEFLKLVTQAIYEEHIQRARRYMVIKSAWSCMPVKIPDYDHTKVTKYPMIPSESARYKDLVRFVSEECAEILSRKKSSLMFPALRGALYRRFGKDINKKALNQAIDEGISLYVMEQAEGGIGITDLPEGFDEFVLDISKLKKISAPVVRDLSIDVFGAPLTVPVASIVVTRAKRLKAKAL